MNWKDFPPFSTEIISYLHPEYMALWAYFVGKNTKRKKKSGGIPLEMLHLHVLSL